MARRKRKTNMVCVNLNAEQAAEFERLREALPRLGLAPKATEGERPNNGDVLRGALRVLGELVNGGTLVLDRGEDIGNFQAFDWWADAFGGLAPDVVEAFCGVAKAQEFDADRLGGLAVIDRTGRPMVFVYRGGERVAQNQLAVERFQAVQVLGAMELQKAAAAAKREEEEDD